MILYKKILGLFKALPLEALKVDFICKVTNSDKAEVVKILNQLVSEGHIKGKRTFKLIGPHKKKFIKNNTLPK